MTDPKETHEEVSEELSTDDLKSFSGGIVIRGNDTMLKGNGPEGSGSGETLKDWKKRNGYKLKDIIITSYS
ncbi:hypothetical protein [Prochlorococcus marinus]|uniref:hypothetical protein n=1 Tax=Prochlorococcus marinus TaxID=1219 RepID=UPI0007B35799|nr:hypothetical protein [Prochlorococcus marinus]KZR76727.1 hypothetical protein PMIT1320_00635 [Prochlorococcus marinus str. MIT 1320]